MAADHKRIAALIVARAKPGMGQEPDGDESPTSPAPDDDAEGRTAAAEDMLKAIDEKNPEALAQAVHALVQMCK